jgi:hypothetical protein
VDERFIVGAFPDCGFVADRFNVVPVRVDDERRVVGGHVPPRCVVRTTAELLVTWLDGWAFARDRRGVGDGQRLISVAKTRCRSCTTHVAPACCKPPRAAPHFSQPLHRARP